MQKTLILNWKHHWVDSWQEYIELLKSFPSIRLIPPISMLGVFAMHVPREQLLSPMMSCHTLGPFTGACGPEYLKAMGIQAVLLGHTEQRKHISYEQLHLQLYWAMCSQMAVLLCLGENDKYDYKRELSEQMALLAHYPGLKLEIAYEPRWAIGSGQACTVEHCVRAVECIREHLSPTWPYINIYYGGSVCEKNADEFLGLNEIQGVLAGFMSLDIQRVKRVLTDSMFISF